MLYWIVSLIKRGIVYMKIKYLITIALLLFAFIGAGGNMKEMNFDEFREYLKTEGVDECEGERQCGLRCSGREKGDQRGERQAGAHEGEGEGEPVKGVDVARLQFSHDGVGADAGLCGGYGDR